MELAIDIKQLCDTAKCLDIQFVLPLRFSNTESRACSSLKTFWEVSFFLLLADLSSMIVEILGRCLQIAIPTRANGLQKFLDHPEVSTLRTSLIIESLFLMCLLLKEIWLPMRPTMVSSATVVYKWYQTLLRVDFLVLQFFCMMNGTTIRRKVGS